MPYKISGWNSFYEGWLARCLGQPNDNTQDESWKEGWKMGDQTSDVGRMLALQEEIILSQSGEAKPCPHIIVEELTNERH